MTGRTYYAVASGGPAFEIVIDDTGLVRVSRDDASWTFRIERSVDEGRVLIDGHPHWFEWRSLADGSGRLTVDDVGHGFEVLGAARYRTRAATHGPLANVSPEIYAPMPGMLLELHVNDGDRVEAGQPIAIIEAMKMENEITTPVSGRVQGLAVTVGIPLDQGAILCRIEPEPAP